MILSKKEKAQILRACEMVSSDGCWHCCPSLKRFGDDPLAMKFCDFYGRSISDSWWPLDEEHKGVRIMALLLFREACGDV